MAGVQIIRVGLTFNIVVAMDKLEQEMGKLVLSIGPKLAQQVDILVRKEKLGYYPALDYFKDQVGIDPNLYNAAEHVASLVCDLVRYEIKKQFSEPFSSLEFENVQSVSFSMPRVRPNDGRALESLAEHYSPNVVRLVINTSSIERATTSRENYEKLAAHKAFRWLEGRFDSVEITDARVLPDDTT